MKVFRHCYTDGEVNSVEAPLLKALSDWGFVNRDGSKIVMPTTSGVVVPYNIRYGLDTKNEFYISLIYKTSSDTQEVGNYTMLMDWAVHNTAGGTNTFYTEEDYYVDLNLPMHTIFLPLKDNGFYLNISQGPIPGNTSYPNVKNISSWTPLPELHTYLNRAENVRYKVINMNIIGLPPKNQQTNWVYLYWMLVYWYNDGAWTLGTASYATFDFGNGIISPCKISGSWTGNYISGVTTSLNPVSAYTNINQNVCSLIKMPLDSGYVENFYLLATAPQNIEPGTFFSFGGRNFLNIFGNYVVELPSQ